MRSRESPASGSNEAPSAPPLQVSKAKRSSRRTHAKPKNEEEPNSSLRARTYYRRKEEKEVLERKVQGLMLQLQHLARRGVVEIRRDALAARMKRN
ncbi:hypothetical protein V7S43_016069 [Phytophthora oleae]|uniref:Uncharacterized protein n=1 Tax=Phytophthora oleae TaxID=2107226 RepID=A0ABD3F0S3_9STRA